MANDINWKSIIEKVFAEYGSQLRRAKVKKFAAKVARQQGRREEKRDLKTSLKRFLSSDSGKKAVQDNGGMLSLEGSAPSAQPAAVKFSLLDLAEAADKMSQEQLSLATGAKQSKQTAKKSLTGPQEARKRKAKDMTNSHDAEPSGGPSMLTRTQLRQQGSNLYEAAAAADAAATPTFSPSAAPVNTRTSKPSSDAEQMSQAQHTATLLPNGEVLRHLPVSERGKNESGAAHGGANRQQQPAAGAADNTGGVSSQAAPHFTQKGLKDEMQASKPKKGKLQDGISAVATLVADKALAVADSSAGEPQPSTSAAEPHEQAAKVSTAAAPAEAFAKKSKAKQTRQDNGLAASAEPLSPTAAADYTGQAHRDTAAAVDTASGIDAAQHPGQKHKKRKQDKKDMQDAAPATDAQTVGPAAVGQSEPTEDVHAITVGTEPATAASAAQQQNGAEVPAGKVKKRKHKSKEERVSAGLDNLLKSSAVEASAVPPVQADVSAGASKQKNKAAEPKQEKRSKDKKRAASEIADQGNAVADRIATGLSSHAVPTEAAVRAEPAVPDEPAELVRKSKKQRRKDKPEPQPDTNNQPLSPAAEQPGTIHITAPASATDVEPASDGTEKPAAKAKRARKAKASAGADSTQDPPASAAPEQPAAKAKPGRKSKAAAGSESADTEAAASPGKATRGRPPKSATAAQGAAASGSGLVTASWREDQARTDVKKGKFSKQEKDTLKQAAQEYAQEHSLPSEDFSWLFATRTSEHKKEAAGAWQVIAQSLPHRTYKAVYACGTRMLHELNYQGKWSKEQDAKLRELVTERGPSWKDIGIILGRLPEGCRDRWRDIKLGNRKHSGKWSEEESETLRSLVSDYLALKQTNEGQAQADAALSLTLDDLVVGPKDNHGQQADGRIILDDIDWDVISTRHGTRSAPQCLTKWYTQLAPSMVSKGDWGSGDDRRLLRALLRSGATHEFQVDWGNLIARNAAQTRRRWRLMLKCVQNPTDSEFHENLHTLLKTFTPDLLPPDSQPGDAADAENTLATE